MKKTNFSIFKQLDKQIFEGLDKFTTSPVYTKITEPLGRLDAEARSLIGQGVTLLLVLFPFIIFSLALWGTFNQKEVLRQKREIYTIAQKILQYKKDLKSQSAKIVEKTPLKSKTQLDQKIRILANQSNINVANLNVASFSSKIIVNELSMTEATITFSGLITGDLLRFIDKMMKVGKLKVKSYKIVKNKSTQLLDGNINILHYGQELESNKR